MRTERSVTGPIQAAVRQVEGDMGEPVRMDIVVTRDGDVILTLKDSTPISEALFKAGVGPAITIQFCTGNGGGKDPLIAQKLRELVFLLSASSTNI